MSRSTAKLLQIVNFIIAFILMVILMANGHKTAAYIVIAVAVVISMILSHFLRCPSCGRGQGREWLDAQYCPHCGEPLE